MVDNTNQSPRQWDVETDVIVVGSGGAGLVAAVTASEYDLQVTLLEKDEDVGGTTAMSGGSIVAGGSPLQAEAGIDDSPEQLVEDLLKKNHGECDPDVARAIAEESGQTIDWFVDELGWDVAVNTGPYGRVGHQTFRRHWLQDEEGVIQRDGGVLVDRLLDEARGRGVEILTDTPVNDLVVEDGTVRGVVAGKSHDERIRAKALLLANGGFGANPELQHKLCPTADGLLFAGTETNEGDGIRWGEQLGAQMEYLTGFLATGSYTHPESVHYPWAISKEGSFAVTEEGDMLVDIETTSYSTFASMLIEQPNKIAYLVFDEHAKRVMLDEATARDRMEDCIEHDVFERSNTIRGLAAQLDLAPDALEATLRDRNRNRHRKLFGPYYGTAVQPAINITQGGLKTNPNGEVLGEDGEPIPSLYAGGAAAAGLSGSQPDGYLSGNGLLHALNSGRIMGRTSAERLAD